MDGAIHATQAQESFAMTVRHLLKLLGAAVLYMVVNVGVSVLYVAIYASLINPGQPPEFYTEYARVASPYSTIFAGMPLLFLWCWWLSRRWTLPFARRSVVGIWIIYVVMDLTITISAGMTGRLAVFTTISLVTKLIAALLGAQVGAKGEA